MEWKKQNGSVFLMYSMQCAETDLVDGIDYSSGLGGCRRSGISVLDSEQQGLSAEGLKVLLSLIFRPAGIPTF